jgi:hypothetical protein
MRVIQLAQFSRASSRVVFATLSAPRKPAPGNPPEPPMHRDPSRDALREIEVTGVQKLKWPPFRCHADAAIRDNDLRYDGGIIGAVIRALCTCD